MFENAPNGLAAQDRAGRRASRRHHRLLRPSRQPQKKHPSRKYAIQISRDCLARRSGHCTPSDMIKDAPDGLVAQDRAWGADRQADRRAGWRAGKRAGTQAGWHAGRQAGGQAGRLAGWRAGGQAGCQAGPQGTISIATNLLDHSNATMIYQAHICSGRMWIFNLVECAHSTSTTLHWRVSNCLMD